MTREHHVAGQVPDWSRKFKPQPWRPFTERLDAEGNVVEPAPWRHNPAPRLLRTDGPAERRDRRDFWVFVAGSVWGVACSLIAAQFTGLLP